MCVVKRICVFCGSSVGRDPAYREAAWVLGTGMARRGIGLVYGGGKVGLMGAIADAVLAAGGEVTGVIPDFLAAKEIAHNGITTQHVVGSMHERKALMAELADAFVAMPGGYGTFEEFCEILTWAQLGLHARPHALLNTKGYFSGLLRLFDHAVAEGFLDATWRALVLEEAEPEQLLDRLAAYRPPATDKWGAPVVRT